MIQNQPLISVIVPVYKVEAYLGPCVESIIAQTYRNLEIILIDDGSPDRCPEMCDAWAQKDSRIKVIHKENGGVSLARNVGLDAATGGYVMFVDSDDLIVSNIVETLLDSCQRNNVLLAMCPLQNFTGEAPSLEKKVAKEKVLTGRYICQYFFDYYASGPVAKLYEKSLLAKSRFVLNRRAGEDAAFNYPIFYGLDNVAFVFAPMYYYRHYADSTTGTYNAHLLDELATFEEMLSFYKSHNDKLLYRAMAKEYYARILAHQQKVGRFLAENKALVGELATKRRNFMNLDLGVAQRIFYSVANAFPRLFLKIFFTERDFRQNRIRGQL